METACYDENRVLALISDGVLAVDHDLVLRQINPVACRLLGIRDPAEALGAPVSRVMEESVFLRLRDGQETQCSGLTALSGREGPLVYSCQCDKERSLFVYVLHGIEHQNEEREELLRRELHAVELADTICEKQLHIVQEIAGLLGETAVETKATVQELKKTLFPEKAEKNG